MALIDYSDFSNYSLKQKAMNGVELPEKLSLVDIVKLWTDDVAKQDEYLNQLYYAFKTNDLDASHVYGAFMHHTNTEGVCIIYCFIEVSRDNFLKFFEKEGEPLPSNCLLTAWWHNYNLRPALDAEFTLQKELANWFYMLKTGNIGKQLSYLYPIIAARYCAFYKLNTLTKKADDLEWKIFEPDWRSLGLLPTASLESLVAQSISLNPEHASLDWIKEFAMVYFKYIDDQESINKLEMIFSRLVIVTEHIEPLGSLSPIVLNESETRYRILDFVNLAVFLEWDIPEKFKINATKFGCLQQAILNASENDVETARVKNERDFTKWLYETWLAECKPGGSAFFNSLKKYINKPKSPIVEHWTTSKDGAGLRWNTGSATGQMTKKAIQNTVSKFLKNLKTP